MTVEKIVVWSYAEEARPAGEAEIRSVEGMEAGSCRVPSAGQCTPLRTSAVTRGQPNKPRTEPEFNGGVGKECWDRSKGGRREVGRRYVVSQRARMEEVEDRKRRRLLFGAK